MERVRRLRRLMLCDPFGGEIKPYLSQMAMLRGDDEARARQLYEMRGEVARLYDIFLRWSELQMKYHGRSVMINVQGP